MRFPKTLLVGFLLLISTSCQPAKAEKVTLPGEPSRSFLLHLPPQYKDGVQLPLVMAFHGGGGTPEGFVPNTGLNEVADRHGFIVVYPAGSGPKKDKFLTWNAGFCCSFAKDNQIDDVGFARNLIDYMSRHYNIDTKHVYATGLSNGALMSYYLACNLSDKIAAIAPVAGHASLASCPMSRSVPILHLHGTHDPCVPYNGGTCGGCMNKLIETTFGVKTPVVSWVCDAVPNTVAENASLYGCNINPAASFSRGDTSCTTYAACRNGADVTLCTIADGGHTWSGVNNEPKLCHSLPRAKICQQWRNVIGRTSYDVHAGELIWSFFSKHRLP